MNLYRPFVSLLAAAGALGLVVSCGDGESDDADSGAGTTPEIEVSAEAMAEAKSFFDTTCSVCHGKTGKGDGPGAVALDPKPRDYTDKEWQKSISDEDIRKTILEGGAAMGKSPLMVAYKAQLGDKPEVVDGLVAIIRSYGK